MQGALAVKKEATRLRAPALHWSRDAHTGFRPGTTSTVSVPAVAGGVVVRLPLLEEKVEELLLAPLR